MTRALTKGADGARRPRSRRGRRALVAWTFALPFALVVAVFMALPVLSSVYMSFTDIRAKDLRTPFAVDFVGLANFAQLFTDADFLQSVGNTLYFVVVGMPLTLVKFRSVFRVGFYMPVVTSIVAIAVVWKVLLQPDFGAVNTVLGWFGIVGPDWLNSPTWAMPAIIAMAVWRNAGYSMVILLAGLQSIPKELYEQSSLDGAGTIRQFRSITVPLLRPTLLFCAVITGIGYLQFFEEPFVMTEGGPLGSTTSVAMEIYDQFGFGNYGYAAAMSWILFAATVLLSLLQFRLLRPRK
jgi:multiple sugar transport system permease protein